MEEERGITHAEAHRRVMAVQNDAAAFHLFLADLYNTYILSAFPRLDRITQIYFLDLLNNFRDIVDPEGYIPLYFHNGNWLETLMRDKIRKEGREVH